MRPMPLLATLLAALPAPLVAQQEAAGSITGTLDLDNAVWYVKGGSQEPGSQWRDTADGRLVRLVGYPDQDPEGIGGAIAIDFEAAGNPRDLNPQNVEVTYYPEGGDTTFHADNENVDLTLTALTVQGDEMALAGDVVATMTPGGAERLVIDAEEDITVDGNFQATLYRRPGVSESPTPARRGQPTDQTTGR